MTTSMVRRVADRYELRRLLGRGGAGAVWLARDTLLDRDVAIKEILVPGHLDEAERAVVRARVVREARAAARLNHPGVITVFDIVHDDATAFLIMELVQAPTLSEVVDRGGPMSPQRAAAIGLQLLEALEAAHAAGIVHRDVKPGNVMVREGRAPGPVDTVLLGDFGVAAITDDPRLTTTGLIIGSPSFMSPEQARGQLAGPEVDLWGLGATLWYAVEGAPPFERPATLATLHAVVSEEPPPPRRAGPLGSTLLGLLAKNPSARPAGAVLREALTAAALAPAADAPPAPGDQTATATTAAVVAGAVTPEEVAPGAEVERAEAAPVEDAAAPEVVAPGAEVERAEATPTVGQIEGDATSVDAVEAERADAARTPDRPGPQERGRGRWRRRPRRGRPDGAEPVAPAGAIEGSAAAAAAGGAAAAVAAGAGAAQPSDGADAAPGGPDAAPGSAVAREVERGEAPAGVSGGVAPGEVEQAAATGAPGVVASEAEPDRAREGEEADRPEATSPGAAVGRVAGPLAAAGAAAAAVAAAAVGTRAGDAEQVDVAANGAAAPTGTARAIEVEQVEAPVAEAPEAPRGEAGRTETPPEAPVAEAPEAPRGEAGRTETPPEAPVAEAPEALRGEAGRTEAPAEAGRVEAPVAEAPQTPRGEAGRMEAPAAEAPARGGRVEADAAVREADQERAPDLVGGEAVRGEGTGRRRVLASVLAGLLLLAALGLAAVLGQRGGAGGAVAQEDASPGAGDQTPQPGPGPGGAPYDGDADGQAPAGDDTAAQDDDDATAGGDDDDAPSAGGDQDDAANAGDGEAPAPDPAAPPVAEPVIPDGWVSYTDPTVGYTVAHPPGWTVRPGRTPTITNFSDPETGTYLRVDYTPDPPADAVADWTEQSQGFSQRHEDYSLIGISAIEFRGLPAAVWEYEYTDGGARLHATNLGVNTGDYGYGLSFQTRAENWEESQELAAALRASFSWTTAGPEPQPAAEAAQPPQPVGGS